MIIANVKKFWLLTIVLIVLSMAAGISVVSPLTVSALSGSSFQAGNIIDDIVFYNSDTMGVTLIQSFLEDMLNNPTQKPDGVKGACDTNGSKPSEFGGGTRAQYAASNPNDSVHDPPYICLNQYYENTTTKANNLRGRPIPAGAKSAAQIIYDVAQSQSINPKVLLVLLQKEQIIVTDDWPVEIQYRSATGYGCPDTAACDSQYYGFYNQVYRAAWQFNLYKANPNSYTHRAGVNNNVRFSPIASCGTSSVFIENQATASLYNYTPYQPNQAALNNLYGLGDGCSAYGNRNFWRLYTDWFGSTHAVPYKAQYYRQSSYPSMFPGQTSNAYIDYRNMGAESWYDTVSASGGQKAVNLSTSNNINRPSKFGASWGSGKNRPAVRFNKVFESDGVTLAANQHIVESGQIARYAFTFTASPNETPGQYREWFQPILEGSSNWDIGGKAWLKATVVKPTYGAQFYSQGAYIVSRQNDSKNTFIKYRNTGNQAWYKPSSKPVGQYSVSLATTYSINRNSPFGKNWGTGNNRPATAFSTVYESNGSTLAVDQSKVLPGQIAKFNINFVINPNADTKVYREWFQPILEGSSNWNIGGQAWIRVTVVQTEHKATYYRQCGYPTISKGSSATCFLDYKNTGSSTWRDSSSSSPKGVSPINLATTQSINRSSAFGSAWGSGKNRPAIKFSKVFESDGTTLASNQQTVLPGQIARFEFTFTTTSNQTAGQYQEWFQPILEGSSNWNIGGTAWLKVTVTN